ncbi:MAG: hypothetical protein QOH74_2209 [Gaiellales bacterium]|jgi:hypothetical protein|nr:hypothetical protein [Gaiellales bacterium]
MSRTYGRQPRRWVMRRPSTGDDVETGRYGPRFFFLPVLLTGVAAAVPAAYPSL